ncbi:hypothetical protein [Candidatus Xianfuyuplasma coldseepsis]|nr:hypothetical protein [Xianfuyuplasma coldseepsis]
MNKKLIVQILFFGALWGIVEATLGYVLHLIPATIAGSILFPIAGLILYRAYNVTGSKGALLWIGVVAATIKSVNFFLPQYSIFKTINPMISIVMEALMVVVVVSLLTSDKQVPKLLAFPIASIAWRGLFVMWMGFQYATTGNLAPYLATPALIADFIIITGLLSGAIGTLFVVINDHVKVSLPQVSHRLSLASFLFLVALVLTYTL